MIDEKIQALDELGYLETLSPRRYFKEFNHNNRHYSVLVIVDDNYFELNQHAIKTQEDIDDLQIVFRQIQDELRKAGVVQ